MRKSFYFQWIQPDETIKRKTAAKSCKKRGSWWRNTRHRQLWGRNSLTRGRGEGGCAKVREGGSWWVYMAGATTDVYYVWLLCMATMHGRCYYVFWNAHAGAAKAHSTLLDGIFIKANTSDMKFAWLLIDHHVLATLTSEHELHQ